MKRARRVAVFSLGLLAFPLFAQRWKIQYFYDEAHDTFFIDDLSFPSAQRGIAVGTIRDELGRSKPREMMILTSDGGEHWTAEPLKDNPRSLFF